jgi:pimeloyl-ACP methyl ester carboxylesterase
MPHLPWFFWLLVIALVPLLFFVLLIAWVRALRRFLRAPEGFDEVVEVRSADGVALTLGHIRPQGDASPLPPVVLCHGLAMNRTAMAFDPQTSLARMLSAKGRDVWVVELRGASQGAFDPRVRDATFDTYLAHDIPALLAHVRAVTDQTHVDWVGFSMGGMLAYAHLGAHHGDEIRRLVTIGSPVHFRGHEAARFTGVVPWMVTPFGRRLRAPLGFLAVAVAPFVRPGLPRPFTRGFRGSHYDAATLRQIMAAAFSDVPAGVLHQFNRWVRDDSFNSEDGAVDYRERMSAIRAPALVIAGQGDRLALPPCVKDGYERLGSPEKRFVEMGAEHGSHDDYDHLDLIMGRRAHEEVFPHVLAWLEAEA